MSYNWMMKKSQVKLQIGILIRQNQVLETDMLFSAIVMNDYLLKQICLIPWIVSKIVNY